MSSSSKDLTSGNVNIGGVDKDAEGQRPVSTTTVTTADSRTSTSDSICIGIADTTSATTAIAGATTSSPSNINMNRMNQEEAIDRLMNDLSQDERSMVIDIFGADYKIDLTKQDDSRFSTKSQPISETVNSKRDFITISPPVTCHEPPPRYLSLATPIQLQGPRPLPRFSFYRNPPAFEHLEFNRTGMMLCGSDPHHHLGPDLVAPTTTSYLNQEVYDIFTHHPVPVLATQEFGTPLSETWAKEQQMTNKRRKKPAPQLKKCASAPHEAVLSSKSSDIGVAASSTNIAAATAAAAAATTMKTKAVSSKMKISKAKTIKRPRSAVPTNTYITHPRQLREKLWNQRLEEAKGFIVKHGHGRIPTSYSANTNLANWAKRQRYHYKIYKKHIIDRPQNPAVVCATKPIFSGAVRHKKPGTRVIKCLMTFQRLSDLEAIGFCMDLQTDSWERNYELLCDYARRNNGKTCCSKHTSKELWQWIGTQRYQRRLFEKRDKMKSSDSQKNAFRLLPERIAKLNAINFCWDDRNERTSS